MLDTQYVLNIIAHENSQGLVPEGWDMFSMTFDTHLSASLHDQKPTRCIHLYCVLPLGHALYYRLVDSEEADTLQPNRLVVMAQSRMG